MASGRLLPVPLPGTDSKTKVAKVTFALGDAVSHAASQADLLSITSEQKPDFRGGFGAFS